MKKDKQSMLNHTFKWSVKFIACVLSLLMILHAVPANVYAELVDALDTSTTDTVTDEMSSEAENQNSKAVFEVVDRREETVKHFRNADGSYVAAQYDYPVHELDTNGEWQDIDNTLAESGSEYATPNARVKFAKKITGNETLFTLHDGNRKITMSMTGANKKVAGQVTNTHTEFDTEATKLQKMMTLDKLSSRILYSEILNDVDLEYVVQPDSIKENIIVKEKGDEYRYSFDIRLNNLAATLQEDGSVCIADPDTNEVVYVIPAGYMFDGAGEYSDAVQYELADNGSGKYTLTVTADAEWINADERVFPVTIDPTIEYNKYYYGSVVESTYVLDSASSSNYSTSSYTYAGYSPSTGNYSTYVKMASLPSIPSNATITNAFLEMNVYSVSNSPVYVGVYRVSGTWNYSTLTYSNRPSAVSSYTDYQRITGTGYYKWDITEFMRGWYDGSVSNYGVMLKSVNSTTTLNQVTFRTERNTSWAPSFIISYQDTKGVEDYYSYYSSSADLAGSGYVNALTGALTFVHSSMSTTDEILPYEVSFTYNSALKGKYYTSANALTSMSSGAFGYGFKMSYDETIKQVTLDTGDDMFVWADSDGTEHYFTIDNFGSTTQGAGYCDEDGLGVYLYLEEDNDWGTGYQIRDDAGNIKRFTSSGYLDYIQDINGNKRKFVRNGSGRVTSITLTPNGASGFTQLQMTYGSSGMLGTVTNSQTGLKATMYYSSTYNGTASTTALGYLRKIIYTYASGFTRAVTFEYNSSGDLIMAKDLKTGSAIYYAYSSGKVTTVSQYVKATETSTTGGMTLGKKASISYGTLSSQYTSAKETSSTSDDVTTYYQFDPAGRVVSAYTQDANNLYGASNRTYDDSSVKKQNAVSSVLQIGTDTVNYLLNPGFELYDEDLFPTHWTVNSDSYCLSKTSSNNSSSTYLYLTAINTTEPVSATQKFKLPAGTYTASATFDRSELGQNGKARLVILDSSGDEIAWSDYLFPFEANRPTADVQETKSVTFTVTGSDCFADGWTVAVEISFISDPQSGEETCILVDNVMLEKSAGASRYSLLGNGGFENNSSSSIPEWTLSNAQRTATRRDGQYGISVSGAPASQAYAYNKVICNQGSYTMFTDIPESYIISGWAKANSAYTDETLFGYTGKPVFALKAVVHYLGTTSTTTEYIPFDDHYTGWQFATGIVSSTLLSGGSYRRISSIDVYCCYDYNIGTAYFDSISVVKDTNCVTNYEYNDYGYVSNVTNSDGNGVDYTYASNGVDITGATSTDGTSVNMTYDANHRLLTETNQSGPNNHKISYTYDAYGNVTSTTISDLGGSTYIRSSTTYSTSQTNFGAVLTSTDPNARISRMFYDSKARLIGTCANDNTGLIYTYDSFGRVTKVEEATYNASTGAMQAVSGGSNVINTYADNDRGVLSSIETATTKYKFTYDDFGNITQIAIAGSTTNDDYILSTSEYAANNGNLTETQYGNGDSVSYSYDNVDRITNVCYNDDQLGTAVFTYTYNANGDLSSHTDSINGETHVYTYDAKGNVAQRIVKNTTGDTVKRIEQYTYDSQGRAASVAYSYVSTTDVPTLVHYGYEYDITGNLTNAEYVGTSTQTAYTYDSFGRLETEVFQNVSGSTHYFDREYYYSTNSGATSNQISWAMMSSYDGKSYDTYYEYDDVGNIVLIEVTDQNNNIILQYNYHYDDKSQLTREDLYYGSGNSSNRTMVYTYDKAGNILSKKKYAYINPASSVSGTPITYSYGYASTWKDRLTSYNGKSLTYDEIGNPLTYGTYSYEWAYGRQLSKVKNGSTEVATYQYNDEGIRTVKVVNGIRHEYDVVGGQINREVIRSSSSATSAVMKDIRYYYDASGKPVAIRAFTRTSSSADFTDKVYYLQTNLQGDVVGIYNDSGTKIYEYAYDAWGNIIESASAPGYTASGNAAHAVNPFRYRGYYYDTETGLYYLQSRYYNPEWGRFLNADGLLSTGQGLLGYNMYAYCGNNPINYIDPTGTFWREWWNAFTQTLQQASGFFTVAAGISQVDTPVPGPADLIAGGVAAVVLLCCVGIATYTTTTATAPAIPYPNFKDKDEAKDEVRDEVIPAPPSSNSATYYHVTTMESALSIKGSGCMYGSTWEGGYVYAWKTYPNNYAIENSGAHMGVVISFKTDATFVMDPGISDPRVQMFGPVVSTAPGPIVVWDVKIVGVANGN